MMHLRERLELVQDVNTKEIKLAKKVFKLYTMSEYTALIKIEDINLEKLNHTISQKIKLQEYSQRLVRDYIRKTSEIVEFIQANMLDKAIQYLTVMFVLMLIGD